MLGRAAWPMTARRTITRLPVGHQIIYAVVKLPTKRKGWNTAKPLTGLLFEQPRTEQQPSQRIARPSNRPVSDLNGSPITQISQRALLGPYRHSPRYGILTIGFINTEAPGRQLLNEHTISSGIQANCTRPLSYPFM